MKNFLKVSSLFIMTIALILLLNVSFIDIYSLPEGFMASYEDIDSANKNSTFGSFVSASMDKVNISADGSKEKVSKVTFKLFGFIPLRTIEVALAPSEEVYIGGAPLGFSINTSGLIVIGENSVDTDAGLVTTKKSAALKIGDIITEINDSKVNGALSVNEILKDCDGSDVKVVADRKGKKITSIIKPALDRQTHTYKIGYWVRDDASGIGTLTFVGKESNKYGALGHPITDFETGAKIPVKDGSIYECNMLGVTKGQRGKPGELRCLFLQGKNKKGTVEKNTNFGVYGEITNKSGLVDENLVTQIGGRMGVAPGKASIYSNVSGVCEEYEIEIIKANYQPKSADKSLVFRVTDKRLLSLTGGIVQGMSGSPILQNGKLVGAVTHVFLSDPTKGYGVYADWMVNM